MGPVSRQQAGVLFSLFILSFIFVISLFSELVANDKPLLVYYGEGFYFPLIREYAETEFGGEFETAADYKDPYVIDLINEKGWMINPIIPFSYDTINYDLDRPAPSPPSSVNWLGTDDRGRDVGRASPLRVQDFRLFRPDPDHLFFHCRDCGGRDPGLLRRNHGHIGTALHRNLVQPSHAFFSSSFCPA